MEYGSNNAYIISNVNTTAAKKCSTTEECSTTNYSTGSFTCLEVVFRFKRRLGWVYCLKEANKHYNFYTNSRNLYNLYILGTSCFTPTSQPVWSWWCPGSASGSSRRRCRPGWRWGWPPSSLSPPSTPTVRSLYLPSPTSRSVKVL